MWQPKTDANLKQILKMLPGQIGDWIYNVVLSVPVRVKITGIVLLPVIILGLSLNYWITTGLSDWLSYILTDVRVSAAMRAGGRSVLLVTFLAAASSIILASFLTFVLTRPLLALRRMAQQVAAGHLDVRAPVWSNDEIGEVAVAINTMTDHLVATQENLARTNRHLETINQIILAADQEAEIHDVLYRVLEKIVTVTGLNSAWVYLRDPEQGLFHLASWYGVPESLQPFLLNQENGAPLCHCQQAVADGGLPPVAAKRPCQRLEAWASHQHPQTHISIPIEAGEQDFGVINLLCEADVTLSADDLELLTAIGAQISEIVANAWLRLKLAEKEMARQALLESLVEAQEDERKRLARELHDGAGQMLTSLLVRLKTLEKKSESPALQSGLADALDVVSATIEQVRELSHRLRPAALEELGLAAALETLVQDMAEEAGLAHDCCFDRQASMLPPGIEVSLYRIAQEALTNVVRHAQARRVEVVLTAEAQGITLRIEDDGCGFSPYHLPEPAKRRHLGLISMHERAAIAGGQLAVYSAPGQGTAVQVLIPIASGEVFDEGRKTEDGAHELLPSAVNDEA
ncbi:MAG: histidine kinase [Chloroflexota bacterium]